MEIFNFTIESSEKIISEAYFDSIKKIVFIPPTYIKYDKKNILDSNDEKKLKKSMIFASSGLGVMENIFIGIYIDIKHDIYVVLYFDRNKKVITVDINEEHPNEECFFYF